MAPLSVRLPTSLRFHSAVSASHRSRCLLFWPIILPSNLLSFFLQLNPNIALYTQLQSLDVSNNKLTQLPLSLAQITTLRSLDASNNNIQVAVCVCLCMLTFEQDFPLSLAWAWSSNTPKQLRTTTSGAGSGTLLVSFFSSPLPSVRVHPCFLHSEFQAQSCWQPGRVLPRLVCTKHINEHRRSSDFALHHQRVGWISLFA